ncbi:triosephosphate isomerase [Phlyctochytrium bullatum]|nr:triosephosphate isomerase [Phlyctochytrium bullatum]
MANTVSDYLELLMAETLVDLDKLRSAARHGVPDEVRGEVWKYLLGVENSNKANEISKRQAKHEEYRSFEREKENTEIMKRVRGEVARYQRSRVAKSNAPNGMNGNGHHHHNHNPMMLGSATGLAAPPGAKDVAQTIESVLSTYLSYNREVEYSACFVYICGTFASVLTVEPDIFYCFTSMMQRIDDYYSDCDLNNRLSDFFMLFRTLIPDLYSHFEEEEVDFKDWATSWFQAFLAKELPLDCVLRLWDTYFSHSCGLRLHVFVLLAILSSQKDNLEDLEQSEIHAVLFKLPSFDMDKVGGNWKMNGDRALVDTLVNGLNNAKWSENVEVVIAPPAPYLDLVRTKLRKDVGVSSQNVFYQAKGAYTGEISVEFLKDLNIGWTLIGHSERRDIFKETDEDLAKKTAFAVKAGLDIIFCVGEHLEDRQANLTTDVVFRQLAAVAKVLTEAEWKQIVIAYEPVWAIGTGVVATPQQAQEVHLSIRKWLADNVSAAVAESTRILYGGSVNAKNCGELQREPDVDGFLVGGACLTLDFLTIIASRS